MVDISVIVPTHNCCEIQEGVLLRRAVDSVLFQTLDQSKIEIILVDDASTDATGELCDEYAARVDNITAHHIKPVLHTGNLGVPRNEGLRQAKGEYVLLMDADDWLGPDCLNRLLAHARNNASDYVLGRVMTANRTKRTGRVGWCRGSVPIYKDKDAASTWEFFASIGCWARLIKRALIEENEIRFREEAFYYEDFIWNTEVLHHAVNPMIANDYDYYFIRRDQGIQSLVTAPGITVHKKPESLVATVDLLASIVESYDPEETRIIWRKVFYYAVPHSMNLIGKASEIDSNAYPDGGNALKRILWDRVRRYYTPEVRMNIALGIVCQLDEFDSKTTLGFAEDSLRYYADISVDSRMYSIALAAIQENDLQSRICDAPSYLSEEALLRLLAKQVSSYAFYGTSNVADEGSVSGQYFIPLKVTNSVLVTARIKGERCDIPVELTLEPNVWGEDYQECGTWRVSCGERRIESCDEIEFEMSLNGVPLATVKVLPWDSDLGRPNA